MLSVHPCLLLALGSVTLAAPSGRPGSFGTVLQGKSGPTPGPAPNQTATPSANEILTELFSLLGVTGVDVNTCIKDVSGAGHEFRNFADDMRSKNYTQAISELGRGISSLSSSINDCGVPQVQTRLDALAAAIKWANISTAGIDKVAKILIGASDLEKDVEAIANAVMSGDSSQIGSAINQLLTDFTSITGGCSSDSKACNFVDGLLKIVMTVANDIAPCEAAISPAIADLTLGVSSFESQNYSAAVSDIAKGLDELAVALKDDSCGLMNLAKVIEEVAPKLGNATVQILSGNVTKIIVEYADVYDEIYQAVIALQSGDYSDFGMQMGKLLQQLRASGCQTEVCVVLQGLLGVSQIEGGDFAACSAKADTAWEDIQTALLKVESDELSEAVGFLAQGMAALAEAVSACDIPKLGQILADTATKLGDNAVAEEIGEAVSILVEGADVTDDLAKASQDFVAKRWSNLGTDLLSLTDFLNSTNCKSLVCKVAEGLLHAAGIALQDLAPCEKDLYAARAAFIAGGKAMGSDNIGEAVSNWATGLNGLATAVGDCGVASELKIFEQEANVFGIANVSGIESVVVHGAQFYEEVYNAFKAFESHDYRSAGQEMGKILNTLSTWTNGHACTSDVCYVVLGVLQFMGDVDGSFKACEDDLKYSWTNLTAAYDQFTASHGSVIFHWSDNKAAIQAGVADLGFAFGDIANSVSDCHMQEFADLLSKLAVKLGIVPEISWLEELIHILIDGVNIEKEVSAACTDYASGNYVGMGFELAKLLKTLL